MTYFRDFLQNKFYIVQNLYSHQSIYFMTENLPDETPLDAPDDSQVSQPIENNTNLEPSTPAEKSIEDIYFQIKTKIEYFRERNENNIYKPILGKLHLIKDNILEIGFYSYDYNMSKMPEFLKAEFSHCQEYSNLLKEYKF